MSFCFNTLSKMVLHIRDQFGTSDDDAFDCDQRVHIRIVDITHAAIATLTDSKHVTFVYFISTKKSPSRLKSICKSN